MEELLNSVLNTLEWLLFQIWTILNLNLVCGRHIRTYTCVVIFLLYNHQNNYNNTIDYYNYSDDVIVVHLFIACNDLENVCGEFQHSDVIRKAVMDLGIEGITIL